MSTLTYSGTEPRQNSTVVTQNISGATGGDTIQDVGDYRIHTFTTVGTSSFTCYQTGYVQLLVVAGGGGSGANNNSFSSGGGGGAGEVFYSPSYLLTPGAYTVVVGAGGAGGIYSGIVPPTNPPQQGGSSSFGALSANGGGPATNANERNSRDGGSGGGAGRMGGGNNAAGGVSVRTANGYGNEGGGFVEIANSSAAAGGGAGSPGTDSYASSGIPVPGGSGYTSSISGSAVTYAAGGSGGARLGTYTPSPGAPNTGSGGSGAPSGGTAGSNSRDGVAGGSGIVIVRYPLQKINLSGTPLFSQISSAASSSAVGAFSLRAVNGTSAKAVNVQATAPLPSFTAGVNIGSNTYSQTLTGRVSGTYATQGSSIYSGVTQPWKAFDNNLTTWWETTGGFYNTLANGGGYTGGQTITIDGVPTPCEWITIQIPTGVVLLSYSMYARSATWTIRMPKNFKIAGSNDGTTWTTVDTQTNQTTWTGQTPITFTVTSSTSYTYFALCVTAVVSSGSMNNLNLGQWTLNVSWDNSDFYADRLGNLLTAPLTGQPLANWLAGATGYVTTWYDQSGAGNHATQTVAANQPVIQRATKGAGYVCFFDGATKYLTGMSYTVLNATNYSFSVIEQRNSSVGMVSISSGNSATDQGFHFGYITGGTAVRFGQYNDDMDINPYPAYISTEPLHYWVGTESSSTGRRLYENGALSKSDVTKTTLLSSVSGNFFIGRRFPAQQYFSGEIYEVLVFIQSLYDLDTTSGIITQIYNNQLSAYGT